MAVCGAAYASAQCSAPSAPGVRICAPTPNSTVVYLPGIQLNSTPQTGAIHKFIIYDNGRAIFAGDPYQTGVTLYDADVRNGPHNIVVNAWDTGGHLLQAKVSFYVIGQGFPLFCPAPKSPGINFCVPPPNSVLAGIPVSATATGYSKITGIAVYLDGKFQFSETGYNYLSSGVAPALPGKHRVTMVAYDSTGHKFSATKYVTSTYDYYDCPPKGNGPCSPGFVVDTPIQDQFVKNSFTIKASILNNPQPITKIVAYLGGTQVAKANGPTLYQTVNNAPSGTHILTLQAWDTAGKLYRVQQNVYINVPH